MGWLRRRGFPKPDTPLAAIAGVGLAVLSDAELVSPTRLSTARSAVLDVLYRRYVDAIHGYAYRRLGSREAAEDATSEVFHEVAHSLGTYRQIRGKSFRSWLFTVAHHVVADHQRRQLRDRARWIVLEPGVWDPSPTPLELALVADEGQWIRSVLAILPPRERQVIELELAGLPPSEIADALALSRGAVHTARSRALTGLRAQLRTREHAREVRHAAV